MGSCHTSLNVLCGDNYLVVHFSGISISEKMFGTGMHQSQVPIYTLLGVKVLICFREHSEATIKSRSWH